MDNIFADYGEHPRMSMHSMTENSKINPIKYKSVYFT